MATTQTVHTLREQVRSGSFALLYPDGSSEHFGNGESGFVVRLRSGSLADLLGDDPLISFGDAYVSGQVDVDGDLADLVSFGIQNDITSRSDLPKHLESTIRRIASASARTFNRKKEDIAHHYDIGNDFFRLWLDDSLTYSCAYFRKPTDTLEQAQKQKIDYSLHKIRLQPNETLLDVGCGWGALVVRAADGFNAQVLGITLSEEQYAVAAGEIESRGLQSKAAVRLQDYRMLAREGTQFDKIVSIGMAEHVGKEHLAEYIQSLETLLKPGGLALLHLITGASGKPTSGWMEKFIFPGSYIPTLAEIINHVSEQDLHIWDVENLGPHYQLTLDHWSDRFEQSIPFLRNDLDDRFVRMWRLYLRAASACFREGILEVHQMLLSRGAPQTLPLTREDLYLQSNSCGHNSQPNLLAT